MEQSYRLSVIPLAAMDGRGATSQQFRGHPWDCRSILLPMAVHSALLRLVLAAILILNGTGSAVASTRMLVEHAVVQARNAQTTAMQTARSAGPACHQQRNMDAPPRHAEIKSSLISTVGLKSLLPDCCRSNNCDGTCLYSVVGIVAEVSIHHPPFRHGALAWMQSAGHAEPVLPQLNRPPIG
jgi:hypothetical protein